MEVEETPHVEGHFTPHPSDVLDMPVDPNEPTYCLCHQVSYGEMIGCDNNDCLIGEFEIQKKIYAKLNKKFIFYPSRRLLVLVMINSEVKFEINIPSQKYFKIFFF